MNHMPKQYGMKKRRPEDPSQNENMIKIPDHTFFYVEQELSSYKAYKLALAQLELDLEDIINQYGQVPMDILTSHNNPGDPVNLIALRSLMIEEKIKYYLARIHRIDSGIGALTEVEKKIANLKYFVPQCYSNEDVIAELNLSRNHFYKIRQDIIYKFSMVFGLL